jgi:cardiolipin synthase
MPTSPFLAELVAALATLVLAGCATGSRSGATETAAPTFDPGDAGAAAEPGGITLPVEPDGTGVAQGLLMAIEGAQAAVHVEMYLLTSDVYIQALASLAARGVDVKVVLNETFPPGTYSSNARSFSELAAAGVGVRWAPTNTGFPSYTHEKAVILDPGTAAAVVWVMTMNLDESAPKGNREYLARDTNAGDVAEAEAIFQADYADTSLTPTGSLVVSPSPQNNAAQALEQLVASATRTLDMEAEELTDYGVEAGLFGAITAKARAGVRVRLVLEESTDGAQAAAVTDLVAAGGQVVGYAYGGPGLYIHAKAIVADGARAYIGSENFSGGSLGENRELGVIFGDPVAVQQVEASIATDFQGGVAYASE